MSKRRSEISLQVCAQTGQFCSSSLIFFQLALLSRRARRLSNANWKKIRLDEQNCPVWAQTCNEISDRRFDIRNVMEHSARSYEIEAATIHRCRNDVVLAQLKIGRAHVD